MHRFWGLDWMHLDFFGLFGIRTGWLALTASDWLADGLGTRVRECESLYSKRVTQSEKPREAEGELESVREEKRRESRDSGEEEGERRERERERSACLARVASSLTLPQPASTRTGQDKHRLSHSRTLVLPPSTEQLQHSTSHHSTSGLDCTTPLHLGHSLPTHLDLPYYHHPPPPLHTPSPPSLTHNTAPTASLRNAPGHPLPLSSPSVRPPPAAVAAAAAPYTRFSAPSLQCALRPSASPTTVTADRLPPTAERHLHTLHPAPPYRLALVHAHTATPWGLPMSQPGAQPFLGESGQGALLDICASACRVTCVSYESPVSWPANTTLHRRCALPLQVTALT